MNEIMPNVDTSRIRKVTGTAKAVLECSKRERFSFCLSGAIVVPRMQYHRSGFGI